MEIFLARIPNIGLVYNYRLVWPRLGILMFLLCGTRVWSPLSNFRVQALLSFDLLHGAKDTEFCLNLGSWQEALIHSFELEAKLNFGVTINSPRSLHPSTVGSELQSSILFYLFSDRIRNKLNFPDGQDISAPLYINTICY